MKTVRLVIAASLIIAAFAACKKENDAAATDNFDPTKFYITGKLPARPGSSPGSNYVFLLRPGGVSTRYDYGGVHGSVDGSYTYSNGHLKLNPYGSNDPNAIVDFTIANNIITAISANWQNYAGSTVLQKIPDADAITGKTFKGNQDFYTTASGTRELTLQFGSDGKLNGFYPYAMLNNGVALIRNPNQYFFLYAINGKMLTESSVILSSGGGTDLLSYGEYNEIK